MSGPDELPDALSGHVVVGRLTLPRAVLVAVEEAADERGLTALQMVREIVAEWVMRRPGA